MTEAASSDKLGAQDAPGVRQWRSAIPAVPSVLVLALAVMVVLMFRFGPILLWAYNLERAGRLMDVGLVWPEQRLVDSLPTSRDEAALEAALGSLGTAMRWRPDHPYAYRLAGQVYTARREWLKAAEAFESARRMAPGNPLLAWENSLVYEQMSRVVQTASRETILPDLASAPIDVPHMRVDTKLCREGQPRTCYVGLTTFTQPLAELPDGPQVAADVLFMHPPARVNLSHPLYVDHAVLHFLLGLDPGARERGTDGAMFQVSVKPATAQPVLLYERTVDRMTATRGWVPGSADLSRWVGQTVTLVLGTTGGPANSTAGDWYGWGDVTLTTREAAQYALLVPEVRMRQAWHSTGFQAAQFLERGRRPANEGRHAEALVWYDRAAKLDPNWGEPWYQMAAVYRAQGEENKAQESWEKAVQLYEQAAQGSPDNRDSWYRLGQLYGERQL